MKLSAFIWTENQSCQREMDFFLLSCKRFHHMLQPFLVGVSAHPSLGLKCIHLLLLQSPFIVSRVDRILLKKASWIISSSSRFNYVHSEFYDEWKNGEPEQWNNNHEITNKSEEFIRNHLKNLMNCSCLFEWTHLWFKKSKQ